MSGFTGVMTVLLAALGLQQVNGHGYLWEPPGRSTMWRRGFTNAPTNFNDNQQFCGGFAYQKEQRGKCGYCGDPYGGPYLHENGGPFFTRVIGRTYTKGQTFEAEVRITASHKGWFEFRLCVPPSPFTDLTNYCTGSRNQILPMPNGQTRLNGIDRTGSHKVQLVLPSHIECDFCMLQWRYHTGNSWGVEPDGRQCLGCGDQEEFYGCANIAITGTGGGFTPRPVTPVPTPTPAPTPQPTPAPTPRPTPVPSGCKAVGAMAVVPGMKHWCTLNCSRGHCPPSLCICN